MTELRVQDHQEDQRSHPEIGTQPPTSTLHPGPCTRSCFSNRRTCPENIFPGRLVGAHVLLFRLLTCLPGESQAGPSSTGGTHPAWQYMHAREHTAGKTWASAEEPCSPHRSSTPVPTVTWTQASRSAPTADDAPQPSFPTSRPESLLRSLVGGGVIFVFLRSV